MSFTPLFALSPRPHRTLIPSTNSRKQHIRFTYDLLHVCLQRGDLVRARRAWAILVKCSEIDWRTLWTVGLALIPGREGGKGGRSTRDHVNYLKRVKLQIPHLQETLLKETILALIDLEEYQEALDELDLYIVTMPFDQNPVLHLYAGMLWLFTAQPQAEVSIDSVSKGTSRNDVARWNAPRVAAAKRHFRRAIALDPGNEFARGWLERLDHGAAGEQPEVSSLGAMDDEDEDEEANIKEEPDITMASYKDEDDDLIALSIKMDTDSDDDDLDEARPSKRPRGYTE
ncbi:RNA polymerase I specific initiation factor [Rhizoctonia solani]|uniref:RNA polymerase I specific initiation factor n=1 Tax=Rhizoctonia solani TaxID=456999 RepID=A0A8H8NWB4_9AGAM|nr:RNA polymerase I specific initiation factor [Rhizoctonia solani]QRW19307.1 RNA polymerase I specific initiation factor [Rhizoctonia solani]